MNSGSFKGVLEGKQAGITDFSDKETGVETYGSYNKFNSGNGNI